MDEYLNILLPLSCKEENFIFFNNFVIDCSLIYCGRDRYVNDMNACQQ